jgi:uncharacterized protein (DUF924 family)
MTTQEDVLSFWFGVLDALGCAAPEKSAQWWRKDDAFDAAVRERFLALHGAAARGECDSWQATARGSLALIVVLDQFPRNMFRGTAQSFATDELALAATLAGLERGQDRELAFAEIGFFYMPLMHSEQLGMQDRCVALFDALAREAAPPLREQARNSLDYAERHRAIVRRFRRFPHRNALLGRTSTAEELEFLTQPGSSF